MSDQRLVSCTRTALLSRTGRFEVWRLEPVAATVDRPDDADQLVTFAHRLDSGDDGGWVVKQVAAGSADRAAAADALLAEARWQAAAAGVGVLPVTAVVGPRDPDPESVAVGVVTPWVASGSLKDAIDSGSTWTVDEIVDRLTELARTLAAVHLAGVVHGDVSPGNVLVTEGSPVFVLSDFGCAGPAEGFPAAHEPMRVASGTPGFAAPEVLAGLPSGTASDVFSLGAVGIMLIDRLSCAVGGPQCENSGGCSTCKSRIAVVEAWCRELCAEIPDGRPRDLCAAADVLEALAGGPTDHAEHAHDSTISRTVEFGPRPVHPTAHDVPASPRHSWRKWSLSAMVGVVVLVAIGAYGRWDKRSEPAGVEHTRTTLRLADDDPPADVRPAPGGASSCRRPGVVRALSASRAVLVDALSLGCAQELTWSDRTLTVRPTSAGDEQVNVSRYRIGRDGDAVFVAEWDCEGHIRPRLYRPSTGEVISYPGIPDVPGTAGALLPQAEQALAVGGVAYVGHDERGCTRLVVDPQ